MISMYHYLKLHYNLFSNGLLSSLKHKLQEYCVTYNKNDTISSQKTLQTPDNSTVIS